MKGQINDMNPFDPTKPVKTRSGRNARVLCVDRRVLQGSGYPDPIVALVDFGDEEVVVTYNKNGKYRRDGGEDALDLVNTEEL